MLQGKKGIVMLDVHSGLFLATQANSTYVLAVHEKCEFDSWQIFAIGNGHIKPRFT